MAAPLLVVVTGPPASGKTSAAEELADDLRLAIPSKARCRRPANPDRDGPRGAARDPGTLVEADIHDEPAAVVRRVREALER